VFTLVGRSAPAPTSVACHPSSQFEYLSQRSRHILTPFPRFSVGRSGKRRFWRVAPPDSGLHALPACGWRRSCGRRGCPFSGRTNSRRVPRSALFVHPSSISQTRAALALTAAVKASRCETMIWTGWAPFQIAPILAVQAAVAGLLLVTAVKSNRVGFAHHGQASLAFASRACCSLRLGTPGLLVARVGSADSVGSEVLGHTGSSCKWKCGFSWQASHTSPRRYILRARQPASPSRTAAAAAGR